VPVFSTRYMKTQNVSWKIGKSYYKFSSLQKCI